MDKPAHTPGPWTIIPAIEYDGDEDELEGAIIDPAGIEGANGDPVCSFGSLLGSGTLYENEADYHLIAAAPDMFSALAQAVAYVETLHSLMISDGRRSPATRALMNNIEASRAALAKARGATPETTP